VLYLPIERNFFLHKKQAFVCCLLYIKENANQYSAISFSGKRILPLVKETKIIKIFYDLCVGKGEGYGRLWRN
jgi:hypothetical protein